MGSARAKVSVGRTVRHRLDAARRDTFVGRAGELELVRTAVAGPELPFVVLHVCGPGGVGKSALLRRFADVAAEAGAECFAVDGRDTGATPADFLTALAAQLGVGGDPVEAMACGGPAVLLIDTFEALSELEAWFRNEFLPRLSAQVLVVTAGRQGLSPAWRADLGWRDLVRTVTLPNLSSAETAEFLDRAGLPAVLHEQVFGLTDGHPLALALAVDVLRQRGLDPELGVAEAPDVVQALMVRFAEGLPDQLHRHALQVCAEARTTSEAVLRAGLDRDDVHDLFEWLRGLSFVASGPHGIFPHTLARDVLVADLSWRDPEVRDRLHGRVRAHATARMRMATGRERQPAILDFLFTEYSQPKFRSYWKQWDTTGRVFGAPATPADRAAILDLVHHNEGPESAAIAARWFDRQPAAFTVYRGQHGVLGFLCWLSLHEAAAADIEADPGTRAAWRISGPSESGEDILMLRFLMDRDAYQGSSKLFNVGPVVHVLHVLDRPRLRWDFLAVADPQFWTPLWTYIGYDRTPEADFTVGGRHYAVFARDWWTAASVPAKWSEILSCRSNRPAHSGAGLPRPEYERAARQALRDLCRPDLLAGNPLVDCRLVRERGGDATDALADLVRQAVDTLRQHPRDAKLHRALDRTYLRPAATQELAAELLGLPFSTYRRHLTQGVARVVSLLWEGEQKPSTFRSGN
ncbi:MAG TPA: ATP-binding protein [Actinophytocola sp.]|uniref:ATP-binding protein n=1 Tax=Actinophytocola sp. TaxID=1872138 RepID=UPI002DBAFDE9|nr:ATP-binding protein [Actinophytocola sp.]HEU5471003.1 ATP-binding protein [Actinophytocola sp.]